MIAKLTYHSLVLSFKLSFKQIGSHTSRAMKCDILRQLDSHGVLACCPVKTQLLKQIIQIDQLSALFCKLFN